jgi:murein L,D-transpeptidase YcbB/YkuD
MLPFCVMMVLALVAGCEPRGQESGGDVARWSPTKAAAISGVPVDSVREVIGRRLKQGPPASISLDQWRHAAGLYRTFRSAPLWLGARGLERKRAQALAQAALHASDDGLRLGALPLAPALRALSELRQSKRPSAELLGQADLMLTTLYASLAEDLLTGQIKPRTVSQSWYIDPQEDRVDSTLARILRSHQLDAAIQSLRPQDPNYDSLRAELARYRKLVAGGGWPSVPPGKVLAPGDSAPAARIEALRRRLEAEGITAGDGERRESIDSIVTYDSVLAGAVATFQARHGIVVDSVLGAETAASLNVPAEYRLGQIAANLERLRWLPRTLGSRFLLVNVPAFRLQAFDGGKEVLGMKVIVGSEYDGRSTPVFSDSMQYVVFRPYWNVPDSIAAKETWPKEQASPGYLRRNGYETFVADGERRVRQKPGRGNALGLVKFIFPNDFNIYLHDTPQEELFEKDIRGFSHGCIRLERPQDLAQFVLGWPADSVRQQMEYGRDDRRVNLPVKIPVYIVYFTSYMHDGRLVFGNDLYQRDEALVRAVGAGAAGTEPARRTAMALVRVAS